MSQLNVPSPVTETPDAIDLSPRQRQVLRLLRDGASNKAIASELGIGLGTVKQHLVVLFRKLGVTNRTAAIAKSLDLPNDGPTRPTAVAPQGSTRLERRPVSVLSILVQSPPAPAGTDDAALRKRVHQAFSDIAYDFGAVFFTHEGGRCDMIFGIRQARRHDALRAVRAAYAVHDRLHRGHDSRHGVHAAVACGTAVVSTEPSGAWSGESLSGPVIAAAQNLVRTTADGHITIDGTARGMIAYLERAIGDDVPGDLLFDSPPLWRCRPVGAAPLIGRVRERETLRARLYRLRGGAAGVVRLTGETGMGKTALLNDFHRFADGESVPVSRFAAAIPDSQPAVTAAGRVEAIGADGDDGLLTPPEVAQSLRRRGLKKPRIVILDDAHLLGDDAASALADIILAYARRPVLFVIAHRGPDPFRHTALDDGETVALGRVDDDTARAIVAAHAGDDAPFLPWAVRMAAGVPGFLTQIADYLSVAGVAEEPSPNLMPPLTLFSMIAERLEALGLDRGLLSTLVRIGAPCPMTRLTEVCVTMDNPTEALRRLVSAGVVSVDEAGRVDIRHPLVGWVARATAVSPETPNKEGAA
jgi:DNA-binding CsgD family transcriptional regulator